MRELPTSQEDSRNRDNELPRWQRRIGIVYGAVILIIAIGTFLYVLSIDLGPR
jgi:hypothetical protein